MFVLKFWCAYVFPGGSVVSRMGNVIEEDCGVF